MKILMAIFLGGGLGSTLRYAAQMLLHERVATNGFPWATFGVNIAGSFLIGVFYALSARLNLTAELRLFLTAGLCGGFTTFSTFSYDIVELIRHGDCAIGFIYTILSVIIGITACFGGAVVARL